MATAREDMSGVAGTDRWGAPVHGASEQAVVLLDDAIESLVALAGDPVAGAEAAVAADGGLVLGQVFLAYLSLYATTPAGIDAATRRLAGLDGAAERAGQREVLHLLAARSWAAGELGRRDPRARARPRAQPR